MRLYNHAALCCLVTESSSMLSWISCSLTQCVGPQDPQQSQQSVQQAAGPQPGGVRPGGQPQQPQQQQRYGSSLPPTQSQGSQTLPSTVQKLGAPGAPPGQQQANGNAALLSGVWPAFIAHAALLAFAVSHTCALFGVGMLVRVPASELQLSTLLMKWAQKGCRILE